jgi:hypothetical protein
MTLDLNKPIRTRDGRAVRILCTDAIGLENGETIVALVQGCLTPQMFYSDGVWTRACEDPIDLVNYEPAYTKILALYKGNETGALVAYELNSLVGESLSAVGEFRVTIKEGKLCNVELLCSTEKV